MKPSNPKDLLGANKLPLHLWPETATALGCLGLLDGALKYGRGNFRAIGVRASIYYDAVNRHLNAWFEGEDIDPDSGLPHMAHALACLAIIVDAEAAGLLTDDRQYPGGYRRLVDTLTPHVERLKKLHDGKDPKHYTRGDDYAHCLNKAPRVDAGSVAGRGVEAGQTVCETLPGQTGQSAAPVPGLYGTDRIQQLRQRYDNGLQVPNTGGR